MDPKSTLIVIGSAAAVALLILIARRWIILPGRKIDRYVEQLQAGEALDIPERTGWDYEISLQSKGFTISPLSESSGSSITIEWSTVVEATAFKRDLFTTDRVCIAFRITGYSEVEVHEEMKGWVELCESLHTNLPGVPVWTDWYMEITTPAFKSKPTPLLRRDEPEPEPEQMS